MYLELAVVHSEIKTSSKQAVRVYQQSRSFILLLCIKIFDDSPQPNQVHILQLGFRTPRLCMAPCGDTRCFSIPEASSCCGGVFKIPYGDSFPRPYELTGTDPSFWLQEWT